MKHEISPKMGKERVLKTEYLKVKDEKATSKSPRKSPQMAASSGSTPTSQNVTHLIENEESG